MRNIILISSLFLMVSIVYCDPGCALNLSSQKSFLSGLDASHAIGDNTITGAQSKEEALERQSQSEKAPNSPEDGDQRTRPESKGEHPATNWFAGANGAKNADNDKAPESPVYVNTTSSAAEQTYNTPTMQAAAENLADGNERRDGAPSESGMIQNMFDLGAAAVSQQTGTEKNFLNAQQQQQGAAQGAADAMADAFDPTWFAMLELQAEGLINVANEGAGQPCSSFQPLKTHENAVWMVMQMYKGCYIPFALLLLLPGAVLTQTKGLIEHGILGNQSDEDAVSPFSGILKALIAIFLIPACQLIVSYTIDIGNSLQFEVERHINPAIIYMWADEQVFRAPDENKSNKILPASFFAVLGKLTEGPEALSGVESQSRATVMLQMLANTCAQSAAFGLVMMCAFQISISCYLLLMGPMAAAFYAWPSGVSSLFSKVFSTWVDAVINVALWKFWWVIVLLCIDTRLSILGMADIYTEWELIMFIAFMVILTYVPFNPFDFKAGEMVSQVMSKAEQAVGKASEEGGGGGG